MIAALAFAGLVSGLLPPATANKTATIVSDPVNGAVTPKAIPGALVDYTITVTNASGAAIDSGSLAVIDPIPAQEKFCVGDLGAAGSGPIAFSLVANLTGLAYTYVSLSSQADDVDFSRDGGATWTYVPTPDADGCDAAVNAIRVHPHGLDAVAGVFSVRFRVKLK
jgi:uncharacterized repeat protein (TIGR01451 family)